jgi:GDPmannose 4,6-dehydratase
VWQGQGVDEVGIDADAGTELVRVDPRYFRPTEVNELTGDASKAAERLGWRHKTSFKGLVAEMVQSDLQAIPYESRRRKDPGHY